MLRGVQIRGAWGSMADFLTAFGDSGVDDTLSAALKNIPRTG